MNTRPMMQDGVLPGPRLDVSILDDGSEHEKEIRSIVFFSPSPPIPLSEDQDPSVDPLAG